MTWGWAVCGWAGLSPPYLDVDAQNRVLFAHVPEADVWLKLVEDGDKVVDQLEVSYLLHWHLEAKRGNIVFLLTDQSIARPSS